MERSDAESKKCVVVSCSTLVAQAVATQGEYATRISLVKGMRTVKKEVRFQQSLDPSVD